MRLLIENKTGSVKDTVLTDESGAEIRGAASAIITLTPNDIVRAEIRFDLVCIRATAEASFFVVNPFTGAFEKVSKVVLVDGRELNL